MTKGQRDRLEAMAGVWEGNAKTRRRRYAADDYRDHRLAGEAQAFEQAAGELRHFIGRPRPPE
jgi:hypothetical protein